MKTKKQIRKNQLETRYNFARQVRVLREAAGLSVKELSQQINMPESFLQKLELGQVENIGTIFAVARFFDKKVAINFIQKKIPSPQGKGTFSIIDKAIIE